MGRELEVLVQSGALPYLGAWCNRTTLPPPESQPYLQDGVTQLFGTAKSWGCPSRPPLSNQYLGGEDSKIFLLKFLSEPWSEEIPKDS